MEPVVNWFARQFDLGSCIQILLTRILTGSANCFMRAEGSVHEPAPGVQSLTSLNLRPVEPMVTSLSGSTQMAAAKCSCRGAVSFPLYLPALALGLVPTTLANLPCPSWVAVKQAE